MFPRGSTSWLIAHELRLSLRAMSGGKRARTRWIIVGVGLLMALVFGGLTWLWGMRGVTVTETPLLAMAFDLALVAIFTLMLSQTLAAATMAFYQRGDLELLLSSPISPGRILAARAIGIATTPVLWFAGMASLVILPLAAMGQFRWTAIYAVLASLGLLAAATGISLAMALFNLIGPRRTRTVGQLLAAVIGAAFFLVAQARNLLPDHGRQAFGGLLGWSRSGLFAPEAPLYWPAAAVLGDPIPLVVFVGASLLLFTLVARGLGRRFAANASVAAGVNFSAPRAKAATQGSGRFGGGVFGNVLRKELRLLLRDPALLSQVLLRALYVLPLAFVLLNNAHHADVVGGPGALVSAFGMAGLAGAVVLMAGQVAGSLSWITISAEDAPELMACAPVDGALVRRAKLSASMIPVFLLLVAPLGALIWLSPWVGICASLGAAASAASAGMINLWFEKPAPRTAFRNRRGGSVLGAIAETLVGIGWGLTTGMAAAGSEYAIIPALLTIGGLTLLYAIAAPKLSQLRAE